MKQRIKLSALFTYKDAKGGTMKYQSIVIVAGMFLAAPGWVPLSALIAGTFGIGLAAGHLRTGLGIDQSLATNS